MFFGKEHMKYIWDEKSNEILKQIYSNKSWDEIFTALGISNKGILYNQASKLGLKRNYVREEPTNLKSRNKFTEFEDEYIINNYNLKTCFEIATYLNRSMNSIYNRIKKLPINKESWSESDIALLKENYPLYTNKYLSENYFKNKSPEAIMRMALKLKLNKCLDKGGKWFDKDEILDQLYNKALEIGKTPLGSELSRLGLPSSTTYKRYFGSYIDACLFADIEPNYFIFGKSSTMIASDGTPCASKSEYKVTEYLISNNIQFIKEPCYRDYIKDKRCGLKRFDWKIGKYFIEFFGMPDKEYYLERMNEKINICKDNDIDLICLYRNDLKNLDKKLHILLQ
jgi:hypothetical protein